MAIARPHQPSVCSMIQEPVNITAKAGMEDMVHLMLRGADKLSDKERDAAASLLLEFKDVMAVGENNLGHTSLVYHSIDTGSCQPVGHRTSRPLQTKVCGCIYTSLTHSVV